MRGCKPRYEWTVVEACAMASAGRVHVDTGNFADSRVSERGIEAEGIDVLPILKDYNYVKMDIEGSEWPVLSDPRWVEAMREVSAFVIEWHAQEGVAGDHRAAAVTAVRRAGFTLEASLPGWSHGLI
jgi:hypothetical protein